MATSTKAADTADLDLSHRQFLRIDKDYERAAAVVDLVYVRDNLPGISREPWRGGFRYFYKGKQVTDQTMLDRIRKLAIPPAWQHVWICYKPNGHIQATGSDIRNRKQYSYHPLWNKVRIEKKFNKLY